MSIAVKKFQNTNLNLSIDTFIDAKQNIYFKAKDIAEALGYENTRKSIRDHVDEKYKIEYKNLKGNKSFLFEKIHPETIFIKEPGLYSLIFGSKLDTAKIFQDWVFSEVLPSIRKYGYYRMFNNPNTLTFKIEDEYDLHTKVVQYIRHFYPNVVMTPGLGENQDTSSKRIESYKKGYQKGQPDLIINNLHKNYNGLCIEFKTPVCNGVLSEAQKTLLEQYRDNGYKTLVSNDYDVIIREINDYLKNVRIKCKYCKRRHIKKHIKKSCKIFS